LPRLHEPKTHGYFTALERYSPLPAGEGKGEGKGTFVVSTPASNAGTFRRRKRAKATGVWPNQVMSFNNPTALRVGMTGTMAGKSFRVAGRVVVGMEEEGETYYWNEFNLVSMEGESATLVYEEGDAGGEWRLFTMFEPEYPMPADDAATKRVGDPLDFGEGQYRVTLVDESRVYHIEGEAPEGVEAGDVARYFNAEAGNKMIVVSWTGEEVEYFRGADLSRDTVMSAFGLRSDAAAGLGGLLSSALSSTTTSAPPMPLMMKLVGVFIILAALFASYSSCRPKIRQVAVKKVSAPASPLAVGSTGRLNGRNYRIQWHTVVEIAQVGLIYDRHEYQLLDDEENKALLVYGSKPGAKDWLLFTLLQPITPLTPFQTAALRIGDMANLDGYVAPVSELFQTTIRQMESADPTGSNNGTVFFGFSAQSGSTLLLARWYDSGIAFYHGIALPSKDVAAAFNAKTAD
jgi:hypothetical protein